MHPKPVHTNTSILFLHFTWGVFYCTVKISSATFARKFVQKIRFAWLSLNHTKLISINLVGLVKNTQLPSLQSIYIAHKIFKWTV